MCWCFCAELAAPEQVAAFVLVFGDGFHPAQWITNNFLHAGVFHLVGNMLFLWSFGLIVEGKLGWYKTLAIYLGIGAVYGLIVQTLMLASSGGALGRPASIFGFMAMCLIWAPENQMDCVLLIGFRVVQFEMKVITLVGLFLVLQLVFAGLTKMAMSSEVLHLIGASVGFPVAIVLLKSGQVDCEYWDVVFDLGRTKQAVARRTKEHGSRGGGQGETPPRRENPTSEGGSGPSADPADAGRRQSCVRCQGPSAYAAKTAGLGPPGGRLVRHHSGFAQEIALERIGPADGGICDAAPARVTLMRLKLAQILALQEKRPAQALKVMSRIEPSALDSRYSEFFQKLRAKAVQLHKQLPNEVADQEW